MFLFIISLGVLSAQPMYLHDGWRFQREGDSIWYNAEVPGTVHQDLMRCGIIDDPFWENNEHACQWVENENWIYQRAITLLEGQRPYLHFEGLDTYVEVYLGDSMYGLCTNMHRRYQFDLSHLKPGEHQLKLRFISPYNYHRERVESYPYQLPSGSEAGPLKVSAFSRKAAYHFGWDWAPRMVTSGIYRNVYIRDHSIPFLKRVVTDFHDMFDGQALVSYTMSFGGDFKELQIEGAGINGIITGPTGQNDTYSFNALIDNPKLWWPQHYGTPHLYYDTIVVKQGDSIIQRFPFSYGLRKVELIQETDSIGTSYYFKINNSPVFARGANYVPQDMLLPRVTNKQYRELLTQAYEANMNMLRVWGGGVYEKDIFYHLCDSLGIMVWQDFMFAGTMYPVDDAFIQEVRAEVTDNIRRLAPHPSIVLWCGNNEIEVAWKNWGWQKQFAYSPTDSLALWEGYQQLFEQEILAKVIFEDSDRRPYVGTSPLSNWGKPENFNHSSMHYWGVWHGRDNFDAFEENVGRFMVEYGFQSFPGWSSLKSCMADSSLHLNSLVMQNRQKSYIGNGEILRQVERYYDPPSDFEDFVYKSQLTQAKALEIAIKAHLAQEGHCMGSLIWQLNDCWPGPSWSLIDYYGREKEAYNSVKKAFAP